MKYLFLCIVLLAGQFTANSKPIAKEPQSMTTDSTLKVIDPVCKMKISVSKNTLSAIYKGKSYHFCSKMCLSQFKKNPSKYIK